MWTTVLERCGIPHLDRILVGQNKAMSASGSSQGLLSFIEQAVGTNVLRQQMESCNVRQTESLRSIGSVDKQLQEVATQKSDLASSLTVCSSLFSERVKLSRQWKWSYAHQERIQSTSLDVLMSSCTDEETVVVELDNELETLQIQVHQVTVDCKKSGKSLRTNHKRWANAASIVEALEDNLKSKSSDLSAMQSESKKNQKVLTSKQSAVIYWLIPFFLAIIARPCIADGVVMCY